MSMDKESFTKFKHNSVLLMAPHVVTPMPTAPTGTREHCYNIF